MILHKLDAVATHAAARPQALACVELADGRRWTYAELDRDVGRCAGLLAERYGLASGARVAFLGRNSVDQLIVQLACARAGLVFQPLNWRLAAAELAVLIEDASPRLLIHAAEFATVAEELAVAPEGLAVLELLALQGAIAASAPLPPGLIDSDVPATLLYTSGTTGRPKGVIVTEGNALATAINFGLMNKVGADSVFLCDTPLFHVVGLFAVCRTALTFGATLLMSPGFDAALTLERLRDEGLGVTHYMCVPAMAQMLRQAPGYRPNDLSRLKMFGTGGAPHPTAQILRWAQEGVAVADGYGMSECGTVLGMPNGDPDVVRAKAGSAGLPGLLTEVRLVGADGRDVVDGEVGEIWVRGPNVSPGYWNNSEATAASRTDGWFRSGDAGRRDSDGFIFLVDRIKDMYISGGENVYPGEVEAALVERPEIAEAAVIGVADERWGEVGWAYVTAAPGAAIKDVSVLEFCRGRLAGYKVPKRVIVLDSLPRNAAGKLQKQLLPRT